MDEAIDGRDITILHGHQVDTIDEDAIGFYLTIIDTQLTFVHVGQTKLIVLIGEGRSLVGIYVIATIYDAVEDNNFVDGIQLNGVSETIP